MKKLFKLLMGAVCFVLAFMSGIDGRTAAAIMSTLVGTSLLTWDISDHKTHRVR